MIRGKIAKQLAINTEIVPLATRQCGIDNEAKTDGKDPKEQATPKEPKE